MTEDTPLVEQVPPEPVDPTVVDGIDPEAVTSAEVISVDELLDRLLTEDMSEETPEPIDTPPPEPVEVVGMDEVLEHLETIQEDVTPHPFLSTSFEDYTVTEGLLLLLLLLAFLSFCIKLLKEGFSWL